MRFVNKCELPNTMYTLTTMCELTTKCAMSVPCALDVHYVHTPLASLQVTTRATATHNSNNIDRTACNVGVSRMSCCVLMLHHVCYKVGVLTAFARFAFDAVCCM